MTRKTDVPVSSGKQEVENASAIHPLVELEKAFDRMVNRDWSSLWRRGDYPSMLEFEGKRLPNLDVVDRDKEIIVRAELPGLEKKDINIALDDNLLTVKGQRDNEKKEEKGDFYRHEITSSAFARSITLPTTVNASKAAATMKDGMLEIRLPKVETAKRQKIEVQ